MGLIEIASANSVWRGVDYCKQNKVLSWERSDEKCYDSLVQGSKGERYKVHVDVDHPRKSSCTCPHAADKRVICKHMIATFFTVEPKAMTQFLEDVERYERELEEEEERIAFEHEQQLMKKAKAMSKDELIEELVLAWLRIEELEKNEHYYY